MADRLCSRVWGTRQIRDMLQFYNVKEKSNIIYGGLVELIVNNMNDVKEGFITWEDAF